MDYVRELRKLIGTRPILMVGAGVLVEDEHSRLLMNLRPDNGLWGIPGGATEPGETVEATAQRETQEETGLILDDLQLFGVFSGPELYYRYPNGDEVYNVSIVYRSRRFHGILDGQNEESLRFKFLAPEEIDLKQISPPVRPIIHKWLQRW